ncbi:tyrosine-protein phosphatase [Serratia silvae]|uniref:tyrosine-protein phosphatase n=1 Tax=Serratia silvae TaxID=2824122 RepID=UPI0035CCDFD8
MRRRSRALARSSSQDRNIFSAGIKRIEQQYGSVDRYLEQEVGVTAQDIARLKQLYTE